MSSSNPPAPSTTTSQPQPQASPSSSSSSSETIAQTLCLDHLVLTTTSLQRTIDFYTKTLGMRHECFVSAGDGSRRHALVFGAQKINLHVSGREFEPHAGNVAVGSADLCFLVVDPVADVLVRLLGAGVEVLEGGRVVERTGARGRIKSVYVRDPDGNLIE